MAKAYLEMLDALRTSVSEIVAANAGDRDERLAKNFTQFGEDLRGALLRDLPLAPEEADPVTFVGDIVATASKAVQAIEAGHCARLAKGQVGNGSLALLKAWVALGDLAARAAATDFAQPIEHGENAGEGEQLVKVSSAAAGCDVLVKTVLPETTAANFLADPADIEDGLVGLGIDLLGMGGMGPTDLVKMACSDLGPRARVRLAKRLMKKNPFPPPRAKDEDEEEEEARAEAEDEDDDLTDEDVEADDDEETASEFGEGDEDGAEGMAEDPIENIARAAALGLVELGRLKDQIPPEALQSADPNEIGMLDAIGAHLAMAGNAAEALLAIDDDPNAMEPGAMDQDQGQQPPGYAEEEDPQDRFRKGISADDLKKVADEAVARVREESDKRIEALETQLAATQEQLAKVAAEPQAPKAMKTGTPAVAVLSKADDNGASVLPQGETEEQFALRLSKLSKEQAAQELIKVAHKVNRIPLPESQGGASRA